MPVNRHVWSTTYHISFSTAFPCPRCEKGLARRGATEVVIREPEYSRRNHAHENWSPDWDQSVFVTMLTCDNPTCGEVVAVSGNLVADIESDFDEDGMPTADWVSLLRPTSMDPAPPLFPISKAFPDTVRKELRLAFQLFWTDLSTSVSRLRTSLERVLDERGVPTTGLDKKNKSYRLPLEQRINRFEKLVGDAESAESMNALRHVGNLGTHGDQVRIGDYFDLLDVYEDALLEIYEKKTASLKAKKKSLMAIKSK